MQAPAQTTTVTVLLFAAFRETVGKRQLTLSAPPGSTPEDVFQTLVERAPGLAALRPFTTFAVNREVAPPDVVLQEGDELALLQPVSGGQDD